MPIYRTQYVKNLTTGESFAFVVTCDWLERFEIQKKQISKGNAPMLGTIENLTEIHEFSLFPAYKELLEIWNESGYTTELISKILKDFGEHESFILKLLEDEDFVSEIEPWFEGITCDGGRASRTMSIVYKLTKRYHSLRPQFRTMW